MSIFKKHYYFLVGKRSNGKPVLFGALKNRGADGTFENGKYCNNEDEARRVAYELLKHGTLIEIKTSSKKDVDGATREWKGKVFTETGDLDMAARRISHKIKDRTQEDKDIDYQEYNEEL